MWFLILLSVLLSLTSTNGGKKDLLFLEGPYVLPSYPKLPERAGLTGSFEVEVQTLQGSVSKILVLSRQISSPSAGTLTNENPMSFHFTNAIEEAVKSWKFRNLQADSFRLTVIFRLVDTIHDSDQKDRIVYRVDEEPFRPPSRIIVEAHRQSLKF